MPKTVYAVYWEGDLQMEFDTIEEAKAYMNADINSMAKTYGKSRKWVMTHFKWTIEKIEYT